MRGYIPPQTDEENLLIKRVKELADISLSKDIARHTGFLSDRQQELAKSALSGYKGDYYFYGGHESAERKIAFLNSLSDKSPNTIYCVKVMPAFSKVNDTALTHRDFLGAFLSLGLKRELIGDIALTSNGCIVFALKSAANIIVNELRSVGKYEMRAEESVLENCDIINRQPEIKQATLPSLRLDAILAAMLKVSRQTAQNLINGKAVTVNHIDVNSVHYTIQENDVFTVKGYGKFKLCEIGGKSRKDRVFIDYQIY